MDKQTIKAALNRFANDVEFGHVDVSSYLKNPEGGLYDETEGTGQEPQLAVITDVSITRKDSMVRRKAKLIKAVRKAAEKL